MTELEILRRRRELVLLSAQLQRATVVRRLDNVSRHPAQAVLGLVTSVASIPLILKVASMAFGMVRGRRRVPTVSRTRRSFVAGKVLPVLKMLPMLRFLPVRKIFPVLKFLNR